MALSDIVTVTISTQTAQVTQQGFGIPLILSASNRFADRIRFYTDLAGLTADGFLTTDPEYLALQAVFSQKPRPPKAAVGRRANLPTQHWTITPTAQNGGTYKVQIGSQVASFTADATATVDEINVGLKAAIDALAIAGITCALVGAAGASTAITLVLTTAGAWMRVLILDASLLSIAQDHADPGVAADLDAILAVDKSWYGVLSTFSSKAEIQAIAAWVEANGKLYVPQSQDTAIITTANTDIASTLKTSAYARTGGIYHPDNAAFAGCAWMGRLFPLQPGSATWKFKTLNGVAAVNLTETQKQNALGKKFNVYTTEGGVNITSDGSTASGEWLDVVQGRDWLAARMQERVFGLLANQDKVPFTNEGIAQIEGEVRAQLDEGIAAHVLTTNPAPTVTAPDVSTISDADKNARNAPGVTFQAYLEGAVHKVPITGTVTV